MNRTITQETLLLYAYNELPEHRLIEVETAIKSDPLLADELKEIREEMAVLDQAILSPNPTSVQIILEESASALQLH